MVAVATTHVAGQEPSRWIWGNRERAPGQAVGMVKDFELKEAPAEARARGVADFCRAKVYVNGTEVAAREPYGELFDVVCVRALVAGGNTIGVCCESVDGPSAVFLELDVKFRDGTTQRIVSDASWQTIAIRPGELDWPKGLNDNRQKAREFGAVERYPWGEREDTVTTSPLEDYSQWERARGGAEATSAGTFAVPPGFALDMVRAANPETEGSWVALAFDPKGRVIIAREKQGLLRLPAPMADISTAPAEIVNDTLHECRGLKVFGDDLFAMANNDLTLFKLRYTDCDDKFAEPEEIRKIEGHVGHGHNDITFDAEGRLYVICGDDVLEPEDARKRPPAMAAPTKHEQARSGFLLRMDRDGSNAEVIARGLRNPYGVAINRFGDAFTYDADAEYDMGAPWYRPTRIVHLVSGGDFGWRAVTGSWPPYYPDRPDTPPSGLDIGKGSPTACIFGYDTNFPPPYRDAFFALDWTYGRILAIHVSPRGAGYAMKGETFLRGRPANVTDLAAGPDGAIYFTTGGRGTQSALYRLRHTGSEVQAPAKSEQEIAREAKAREVRRSLERFHGVADAGAADLAWRYLEDADPTIRSAARAVIESQPLAEWNERALSEARPRAKIEALLALVRAGGADEHERLAPNIHALPWPRLRDDERLKALFLYERLLDGPAKEAINRHSILAKVTPLYPDRAREVNVRLSLLLKRVDSLNLVTRTLDLLDGAETQEEEMHYLFVLRDAKEGWTDELRTRYFERLTKMREYVEGEGSPRFRKLIQEEALANAPEGEREKLQEILDRGAVAEAFPVPAGEARAFVREWAMEELRESVKLVRPGRDLARGRQMFAAAKCAACHRMEGKGGVAGPDLSSVSSRFAPVDVLSSILAPSQQVAEQFRLTTFLLRDGRVVTGRVLTSGDYRLPKLRVATDPLDPARVVEFEKKEIESTEPASVSPMPSGLLSTLSQEEILDLLAYIDAGGAGRTKN